MSDFLLWCNTFDEIHVLNTEISYLAVGAIIGMSVTIYGFDAVVWSKHQVRTVSMQMKYLNKHGRPIECYSNISVFHS